MRKYTLLLKVFLMVCVMNMFSCGSKKLNPPGNTAYVQEIKNWHQQRISALTKKDGWLTLAGLFWLKEGENRFGSDSSNAIVFPPGKAPAFIGKFILKGDAVQVEINRGIKVLSDGKQVQKMMLQSDAAPKPNLLSLGSLNWYILKRGDKFAVRLKDSSNAVRSGFKGIEMFPVDAKWRIKATFKPYPQPQKIAIPTVLGNTLEEPCIGELVFKISGKTLRLAPMGDEKAKSFFIVFADQTNGKETYPPGRFLAVDKPDANGVAYIDFNKAYNPPCAFTPYATCPLPPEQNRLSVSITAGEKKYQDGAH